MEKENHALKRTVGEDLTCSHVTGTRCGSPVV